MVQKRILRFDPWGDEKSKKSCKITLRLANKYIYNFFKHKQYLINQKLYKKDGAYFVIFTYNDPMEVAPVIFQWLNKITIEDIECELGSEKEILIYVLIFLYASKRSSLCERYTNETTNCYSRNR